MHARTIPILRGIVTAVLCLSICSSIYAQEICDNGIDDDGDGMIDINDDECACIVLADFEIEEDFEGQFCCPTTLTFLTTDGIYCLASDWGLVHGGTADYFHTCDFMGGAIVPFAPEPFPEGDGAIGLAHGSLPGDYGEGLAICLDNPLSAGTDYTFEYYIGFNDGVIPSPSPVEISIYGKLDCSDIPSPQIGCLEPIGWEVIVTTSVSGADSSWTFVSEDFEASEDYEAIAIAPSCAEMSSSPLKYHYLDGLRLVGGYAEEPIEISDPILSGNCVDGYTLSIDEPSGNTYQWYLDGAAISGATGDTYDLPIPYTSGEYQVRISFSSDCAVSSPIFFEPELDVLNIVSEVEDETCFAFADGEIQVFADSDNEPLDFAWDNGESGDFLDDLASEVYIVTVTDANGCFGSTAIFVQPAIEITCEIIAVVQPTVTVPLGSATVETEGGSPPYDYEWTSGETSATAVELEPGLNFVTVTDINDCEHIVSVLIAEPFSVSDIVIQPSCFEECNGVIELFIDGGLEPYSINWNVNESGTLANNLCDGFYEATVIDANFTEITVSFTLEFPPEILVDLDFDNLLCSDETGTDVYVEVQGGVPDYRYAWSNGTFEKDQIDLGPGSYILSIYDDNNCFTAVDVFIEQIPEITFTPIINQPTCDQTNIGSIELTDLAIEEPYQILWEDGSNTLLREQLEAGEYTVSITDAFECVKTDTFFIEELSDIEVVPSVKNASCIDSEDGMISLDISGGVQPYSISWNGDTSNSTVQENLASGNVEIIVEDANGCSKILNISIEVISTLEISALIDSLDCYQISDGSIEVTIETGIAPFNFLWNESLNTSELTDLGPGNYELEIIDSLGCRYEYSFELLEPAEIEIAAEIVSNPCPQDSMGSIIPSFTNATFPLSYVWNTNQSDSVLTNIPNGQYTLTITDANNCEQNASFMLEQEDPLEYSIITQQANCLDPNAASIEVVWQSNEGVDIVWDIGSQESSIDSLSSGSYSVTITDMNGCRYEETIEIFPVDIAEVGFFEETYLQFCGFQEIDLPYNNSSENIPSATGQMFILCTDPENPLNTILQFFDATTFDPQSANLIYGETYYVISVIAFIDQVGNIVTSDPCLQYSEPIALRFYPIPEVQLPDDMMVCPFDSIEVEIETFGLQSYDIRYSVNGEDVELSNVSGNQTVIISSEEDIDFYIEYLQTIEGNCTPLLLDSLRIEILKADTSYVVFETCESAEVQIFEDLEINQFGCDSLVITEYLLSEDCDLEVTPFLFPIYCNTNSTDIYFEIANGEAPYSYTYSNTITGESQNGQLQVLNGQYWIYALSAGMYTIDIVSSDGKTFTYAFELIESVAPTITLTNQSSTLNGFDIQCYGDATGELQVDLIEANGSVTIIWSTSENTASISELAAGTYWVNVIDEHFCETSDTIILIQPDSLSGLVSQEEACFGSSDGVVEIQGIGGVPNYEYTLDGINNGNEGLFESLQADAYTLGIVDANGCEWTVPYNLSSLDEVLLDLGEDIEVEAGSSVNISSLINVQSEDIVNTEWIGINSSCNPCLDQNIQVDSNMVIDLIITTIDGCTATDQLLITVWEAEEDKDVNIFIPNVFNSNNQNFFVGTNDQIEKIDLLQIYDRWGNLIFENLDFVPNQASEGWNGMYNDHPCDQGVYVYFVKYSTLNQVERTIYGDITLLR